MDDQQKTAPKGKEDKNTSEPSNTERKVGSENNSTGEGEVDNQGEKRGKRQLKQAKKGTNALNKRLDTYRGKTRSVPETAPENMAFCNPRNSQTTCSYGKA